jgi:hypothetical protein
VRPLTDGELSAAKAVGALAGGLGLLGFANSFRAVARAAAPSFGAMAPTVPLGIDLAIAVFSAMDIVLARLDMRPRWVRLVPWSLTGATIYLNIAGQVTWFGRVAHAVFPALWVVAVSLAAHVIRVRAHLASGTAMDRVRASRWLLAPVPTARLWRRMVLWEIRSYPGALDRERARLLALTDLQDAYGVIAWRWKAPRRTRAMYRLGELAPQDRTEDTGPGVPEPAPAGVPAVPVIPVPEPAVPEPGVPDVPGPAPAGHGLNGHAAEAESLFAASVAAGVIPPIRVIRSRMHVGSVRAKEIQQHLETRTPAAQSIAQMRAEMRQGAPAQPAGVS